MPGQAKREEAGASDALTLSAPFAFDNSHPHLNLAPKYRPPMPPSPLDEAQRLAILQRYAVLDGTRDEALDDLTELAMEVCETPYAVICLVDADRQWFKSRAGLTAPAPPRALSFCQYGLESKELFIVPDTTQDPRFAESPLVTGESHVRFYAGAPLLAPEGAVLGRLCVMDRVPRTLTARQERTLRVLARQAMTNLEFHRQQRELFASEERLFAFMQHNPAPTWIVDGEGCFGYVSPSFCEKFGGEPAELIGRTIGDIFEPDLAREYLEKNALVVNERRVIETVDPGRRKDGSLGHFLTVKFPIDGPIPLVGGMAIDVTERMAVENALRVSEARFNSLFRSNPAAIGLTVLDTGRVVDANDRMCAFFGRRLEELIGRTIVELKAWAVPEQRIPLLEQVRACGSVQDAEVQLRRRDGEIRDVLASLERVEVPGETETLLVTMFIDITEQKRVENALRASEERYRTLVDHAPDGIVITDRQGRFLDANASACRMVRCARQEIIGVSSEEFLIEKEIPQFNESSIKKSGVSVDHVEWKIRRRDGSTFESEVMSTEMPDGNTLSMIRDITDRKRAEARFLHLVNSNIQGVNFWNSGGEVLEANDEFLKIVGYSREELEAGRINWVAITPNEYAEVDEHAMREMEWTGSSTPYEKEFIRKDGTRVPILIGAAIFADNPDEGVSFVLDLTERKNMEQQFLRAQRIESIGTLANGIAHDLNNAFGPILLSLAVLNERVTDESSRKVLAVIESSAKHGATMVRQLVAFARGADGNREEVRLDWVIAEVRRVAEDTFLKSIDVQMGVPDDLWQVHGDPTQLRQVLLNLCVNARDAMPAGGRLTVSAENLILDTRFAAENPGIKAGRSLKIRVEDTGTGIPPEILERIFDPFFTTKKFGAGTGLGLSSTLSIVKGHGGIIRVESEPGQGSRFDVYLPASTTPPEESAPPQAIAMPRGHGELILVIDDEEAVRKSAQQLLELFGYQVVLANNGAEGVAVYAQRAAEIAVVLTDMMMPVMDGPAAIKALREKNPRVEIIAASGLSGSPHFTEAARFGVKHFLSKPYTAAELLKILQEILGERSDANESAGGS